MEPNKQLSIVIPTYNRAEFLDYSLEVHIPICKDYNIQIFISDNASTDNTENVVKKWMKEYEHLHYSKNEINIGPDGNFEKALKLPATDYVWLLSDTYQIPSNGINYLLSIINDSHDSLDSIVFNLDNKINIHTRKYQNQNELLNNLGALMTCAAINIYNRKLIEKANFFRFYDSSFIQTGIIFESIANRDFNIYWSQEHSITSLKHPTIKKTNWSHTPKAFEIGCEDWTNFVMSLPPSYKLENKMKCIMDFGKVSGLFTFRNLILLRIKGLLNTEVFNKYKKLFPLTIDYSIWVIYIVTITPKSILGLLVKGYQNLKGRR